MNDGEWLSGVKNKTNLSGENCLGEWEGLAGWESVSKILSTTVTVFPYTKQYLWLYHREKSAFLILYGLYAQSTKFGTLWLYATSKKTIEYIFP